MVVIFMLMGRLYLDSRLRHCLDALGAEHFAHGATLFHNDGLLQVRFELAVGGSLGEGAVVSKGCGFSTMCAFSHVITSFLAIIPSVLVPVALSEGTTFYHVTFLQARC